METTVGSASGWAARHRDDLVVAAIFVAARVALMVLADVRMDLTFLGFAPHLPDLGLLQDRLAETILYEHTQPPLYPLLIGVLLKASPLADGLTLQVAYLAQGLALVLVLRRVCTQLGLGRAATYATAFLVVTNPALVAVEFTASYDQPTIVLLAVLVLLSGRYVASGETRDLAAVAATAALVVLVRTVFHPIWFVLALAGLVALRRPRAPDRRTLAVVLVPLLVIGAFVAKNAVLYGQPTLTTWAGPSLSKIAGSAARPAERDALVAAGTVSPLFGRPVFFGYAEYADAMAPCTPERSEVAVLAQETRPSNGSPNLNYECLLPVYEQQQRDAFAYARAEPIRFLAADLAGTQLFFEPALPIIYSTNEPRLRGLDDAWAHALFFRVRLAPVAHTEFGGLRVLVRGGIDLVPTLLVLDLAAIGLGLARSRSLLARRRRPGGGPRRAAAGTWAALGLVCCWTTGVGSLLEINENARYRQLVEPFLLATGAYLVQQAVREVRRRRGLDPAVAG